MKGVLAADHIPVNKFQMLFFGLPPLTFTEISGLEKELETTDLPDRTTASGGNTGPVEFTAKMPLHHVIEQAAMENWFDDCQDPVAPNYKKPGTLVRSSISGAIVSTRAIIGAYLKKRGDPDQDMANEGELATVEWTFKADDILTF